MWAKVLGHLVLLDILNDKLKEKLNEEFYIKSVR